MARDMTKDMTNGNPLKLIISFAGPVMLGMLFQQLYSMVDSIIVGKYVGLDALAAVGSTGSINFMIIGFAVGVCSGFSIPVANKFGAKDFAGLKKIVGNSVILSAIISVLIAVITVIFCRDMLELMNTPDNIIDGAYNYIAIIFAGTPIIFLYNMTSGIIRAIGDSKTPVYFLLLSSVLNVGLDMLFIAGFGMEEEGAAIATIISQLIAGVLCVIYMSKKFEILKLSKSDYKLEGQLVNNLCVSGIPMGLQFSITAIGSVILQTSVNGLGSNVVAAITAASKVSMFVASPIDALGVTIATFAGQNIGANKLDRISKGVLSATIAGMAYSIMVLGIVWLFGKGFLTLFIKPEEMQALSDANIYLLINVLCYAMLVIVNVFRNAIQGMGASTFAMGAGVFEMVARILCAYLMIPTLGFYGACLSNGIAWIFADVFLIPAFIHVKRRLDKLFQKI